MKKYFFNLAHSAFYLRTNGRICINQVYQQPLPQHSLELFHAELQLPHAQKCERKVLAPYGIHASTSSPSRSTRTRASRGRSTTAHMKSEPQDLHAVIAWRPRSICMHEAVAPPTKRHPILPPFAPRSSQRYLKAADDGQSHLFQEFSLVPIQTSLNASSLSHAPSMRASYPYRISRCTPP